MSYTLCVFAFGHVSERRASCVCVQLLFGFYVILRQIGRESQYFKMIFIMAEVIFVAIRPSQLAVADRTSSFVNADIYCVIVCT